MAVIRAIIYETDAPFRQGGEPSSLSPDTRLAGLTLLQRAAFLAWRAGAGEVVIASDDPEAEARWQAGGRELPVPLRFARPGAALEGEAAERTLLLSALVLPEPRVVERLCRQTASAVATGAGAGFGPALLPGDLGGRVPSLEAAAALLRDRCRSLPMEPGGYRYLEDRAALRDTDRALYRELTSVSDGYIDRVFNRPISRWFTRQVIDLPVTPNQVTYLHFALGLAAAALFWSGDYARGVVGAVLLQVAVALDCADGEIARLKYQFSKFGSWLDVAADNLVTVAVFAAAARVAADRLGVPTALTLGLLSVTGVAMCVLTIALLARLQARTGRGPRLAATSRLSGASDPEAPAGSGLLDAVINEATSRDFTVIVVACVLFGRLDWLAWLAGIGSHVFWVMFGLIQLSMLRTAHAQDS